MSKFSTAGVQEAPEFENKWIKAGINENVVLHSIEAIVPEDTTKSPYLEFGFRLSNGTDQDLNKVKFYMSDSAATKSIEKIKHIATKLVTEEQIDAVTGTDLASYGKALNNLLSGKVIREMKFVGEEYLKDGKVRVAAKLGLPKFASKEVGTLKYNPNSEYDLVKLPVADAEITTVAAGDGLPF
tara:strand:+ start:456 stop:1007 length:552 start_codon:yes stop_codon:yes gene_type:complete